VPLLIFEVGLYGAEEPFISEPLRYQAHKSNFCEKPGKKKPGIKYSGL